MSRILLLVLFIGLSPIAAIAGDNVSGQATPAASTSAAEPAINFSLLDYRGKYYELRRADARVVVLYFVGLDCPIARQSINKVDALQAEFKTKGVVFWLINAMSRGEPDDRAAEPDAENQIRQARTLTNLQGLMPMSLALGDKEELKQNILTSQMGTLPLLRDDAQLVTHHFGVTRTCEAIAVDMKSWTIIYRGALDDQMVPGAQKPKPTENYLQAALAEFFAGKPVAHPKTAPQGCLISFNSTPGEKNISYTKQIAPLIERKCAGCHSAGNIGPFELNGYDAVKHWSAMMQEVVLDRRMPPWDADPRYGKFANDRSLAPAEARMLLKWLEQDCPRGEASGREMGLGRAGFHRPAAQPARDPGDRGAQLSVSRCRFRNAARRLASGRRLPAGQSQGGPPYHRPRSVSAGDQRYGR